MSRRKPPEERQRRNAHQYARQSLVKDGQLRGPSLPDDYHDDWCPATIRFWDDFRASPNAKICTDADWESLLVAAMLHNRIWKGQYRTGAEMTSLSKELRTRMAPYGYTYEDRLKFNIEIIDEDAVEEELQRDVEMAVDYFSMLTQRVAEEQNGV